MPDWKSAVEIRMASNQQPGAAFQSLPAKPGASDRNCGGLDIETVYRSGGTHFFSKKDRIQAVTDGRVNCDIAGAQYRADDFVREFNQFHD